MNTQTIGSTYTKDDVVYLVVDREMMDTAVPSDDGTDMIIRYDDLDYTFGMSGFTIDTSLVTDMSKLFFGNKLFNSEISHWDVSNVTNMSDIFHKTISFNQNISEWNINDIDVIVQLFHSQMKIEDSRLDNVSQSGSRFKRGLSIAIQWIHNLFRKQ